MVEQGRRVDVMRPHVSNQAVESEAGNSTQLLRELRIFVSARRLLEELLTARLAFLIEALAQSQPSWILL